MFDRSFAFSRLFVLIFVFVLSAECAVSEGDPPVTEAEDSRGILASSLMSDEFAE